MILQETATVSVSNKTKHYYNNLGYNNIKQGDVIDVKIPHLYRTSKSKVLMSCDNCGKENYVMWSNYTSRERTLYLCKGCNNRLAWGHDFSFVENTFKDRGYIPLFDLYENQTQKLKYICPTHSETIQSITYQSLSFGCGCYFCGREKVTGKNNSRYNGLRNITRCFRQQIELWAKNKLTEANYTCCISGQVGGKLNVHHLSPFNELRDKLLLDFNLTTKVVRDDISTKEYDELIREFLVRHEKAEYVVLTKELHSEFHRIYGIKYFTPEDFKEFKNNHNTKLLTY